MILKVAKTFPKIQKRSTLLKITLTRHINILENINDD